MNLHDGKERWSLKASSKTQGPGGGHVKATYYLASRAVRACESSRSEKKLSRGRSYCKVMPG